MTGLRLLVTLHLHLILGNLSHSSNWSRIEMGERIYSHSLIYTFLFAKHNLYYVFSNILIIKTSFQEPQTQQCQVMLRGELIKYDYRHSGNQGKHCMMSSKLSYVSYFSQLRKNRSLTASSICMICMHICKLKSLDVKCLFGKCNQ